MGIDWEKNTINRRLKQQGDERKSYLEKKADAILQEIEEPQKRTPNRNRRSRDTTKI